MTEKMTYAGVGVKYDTMDTFKRACQKAGLETSGNITRLNGGEFQEFEASRGESAYLIEAAKSYLAHVEEGLGTKNRVADIMYTITGKSYYDQIAQCTVAMIVNDMITVGALPLSVAMHIAVGISDWFSDEKRTQDLVNGWKKACDLARCVWGGGETPTLKGLPYPILSGSAMGIVKPKQRLIQGEKIRHGDAIVIIESSGIHANGLTLAQEIAKKIAKSHDARWRKFLRFFFPNLVPSKKALRKAYLTKLSDARTYGETLLDPTHIYVGLVEDCLNAGVDIHYAVNITGHGWRKLMRATQPFTYVIERLPRKLPIFEFIQQHGPVDDAEAYGNLNMGAGFALYVPGPDVLLVLDIAKQLGYHAFYAGDIERGEKKVVIKPKDLEFTADTLAVR